MDGQGPDVFDAVYDFVMDSGLYEMQITVLTPFPGTPLYARLKQEGRLIKDPAWHKCTLYDINFHPKNMTVEELQDGFYNLGLRLYGDECAFWKILEPHPFPFSCGNIDVECHRAACCFGNAPKEGEANREHDRSANASHKKNCTIWLRCRQAWNNAWNNAMRYVRCC